MCLLPTKPPLVIGVTGPIGSGVSTVSRELEGMGFRRYKVSDAIRAAIAATGEILPPDGSPERRSRYQDYGNEMRRTHGPQYWVEQFLLNDLGDRPVVIDGVRNLSEVTWVRDHYPSSFIMAVLALRDTRWERLRDTPQYAGNERLFTRDDDRDWD